MADDRKGDERTSLLPIVSSSILPAVALSVGYLISLPACCHLYCLLSHLLFSLPLSLLPVLSFPVPQAAILTYLLFCLLLSYCVPFLILMLPAATASSCSLISWSSYRYPFLSLLFCLPPSLLPPTYLFSFSSPLFACLK
jgi:hypothetical protein